MNSRTSQFIGSSVEPDRDQKDAESGGLGYSDALVLINPIASHCDEIVAQVNEVSEITGLDFYTVRQKLTGAVMDILFTGNNSSHLQDVTTKLNAAGYQAAFIQKHKLLSREQSRRAVTAQLSTAVNENITFFDINGVEILQWNPKSASLLVAGALAPEQYGSSRALLTSIYGESASAFSRDERISDISKQKPALMLYPNNNSPAVFIDATMFNYEFLGDMRTLSLAQNFIALVNLLKSPTAGQGAQLNVDFGQKTLPLGKLATKPKSKSEAQDLFTQYARLVCLAHRQDFYRSSPADLSQYNTRTRASNINPVAEVIDTVTLATISSVTDSLCSAQDETMKATALAPAKNNSATQLNESSLPPPPRAERSIYCDSGIERIVMHSQRYGPPAFILGSIAISITLAALAVLQQASLGFHWSYLPIGLAFCVASVTFARRKGVISRLPTSKIRSMPMGLVEVKGQAKRKFALKAPHSLAECIYYSYRVLERTTRSLASGGEADTWRVISRGNSGRIPFYIEDATGKALIDPTGAIISGAQTSEFSYSFAEMVSGVATQPNRRIIETVIAEGAELYVLGFARPTIKSPNARRNEYRDRLKALKSDPELMARFDADGDGTISFEEWAVAKAELDDQILQERLDSDSSQDSVIIGKHSGSGIFYISDKVESDILSSYSWKAPALGALGFALLVKGLWGAFGN